ncbi:MAG: muconolactone Delta-isomerase family protein [bacterium]
MGMILVVGSEGPGFTSPQEAIQVLEKGILPTFNAIMKLQKEKKIIAGGLPVGDRAFVFIVEASSNGEVDKLLRSLPAWGALKWKVTALETFAGRAAQERAILNELKKITMK